MTSNWILPSRKGKKPTTTDLFPHSQLNQHGTVELANTMAEWAFTLTDVREEHSRISVPGARAMVLTNCEKCNHEAFMIGEEFAHIHPAPDQGSMHLTLPEKDALEVINKGWGEDHLLVRWGRRPTGLIMVFSPRGEQELSVVKTIIQRAHDFATDKLVA